MNPNPPHLIGAPDDPAQPAPHKLVDVDVDSDPADVFDEAPARRQPGQLVELFLAGRADVPVVRITNRERIAYEKTAARHREWPPLEIGKHFAMTFMCYVAAKRDGLFAGTFEGFCEALDDWEPIADEPADPTRPGA